MQAKLDAAWEVGFAVLCVACVWPLFSAHYPPIQDLPQHLAAVRILHDFDNPAFGFQRYFELNLADTQYLSYYLAAHGLAYVLDVELAQRVLIAAALVAIPHSIGSLLHALGKDPRFAVLSLPLTYSAHLILGFLNFVAAIPLAFYGVALAVRLRRAYSTGRALWLAAVILICFYTHVVPFALLALGVALVALGRDLRTLLRGFAPLAPALVAAVFWTQISPAGQATANAASGAAQGVRAEFVAPLLAYRQLPRWLTDVFDGDADQHLLLAWAVLMALLFALGLCERLLRRDQPAPDALARSLALRMGLLPPLCALLYFVLPTGYSWIWPIAPRFPLLCALWSVAVLPSVRIGRAFALVAALLIAAGSFYVASDAFTRFEREEVGDFDRALAALPPGKRVVGLIFDRHSRHVAFAPFIHYVAYYQARKGGAVMFTFADFPQSPFHFREERRPPRVPPRWEWLPQQVRPSELGFYDYALIRGGPGALARTGSGFRAMYRGERWSVWRNAGGQ